jgi:hypothetical protein
LIGSHGFDRGRLAMFLPAALATIILFMCCLGASPPAFAQEKRVTDDFAWKKDNASGSELAASRSDSSFNFFDVGDLSYYSQYLVEQDLRRLAGAAGLTMERSPAKNSLVSIVHDTKVFERLRNDKAAFNVLGLPPNILAALERQVTSDSQKCLTMTITDEKNNILSTIILLSEKFDSCLIRGVLDSFGIAASDINVRTLVDVCVLYEGRRMGLRDRQSLDQEAPKLRALCIAKAGEAQ